MKKAVLLAILAVCCLSAFAALAQEGPTVWTVAEELPLEGWQRTVDELSRGRRVDVKALLGRILAGETVLSADETLQALLAMIREQILDRRGLMLRLLAPALLCGLLAKLREAFAAEAVAEISHWACYLWVATIVTQECVTQVQVSRGAVDGMALGMQALFPMLLTLLVAVGGTSSAAFFQPAVVAASGTMTTLVRNISFSLALAYAVLAVLDNVSENFSLSRLSSLVKTASSWTLGICFTVFIGVMAVQGFGAAAMDGVTLRTAKYAIDNFVPVVGGMFADTMDTLVGCSLLVKNALGVTGVVLLAGYLATPLLRVLSTVLALRLVAAVLEPVADSRVTRCMGSASDALVMLATTQLSIAAMFFLVVTQLLVIGNMTVMMR
ncbi:MAG: stage III sporulation protein AE [Firmicutes bacterium]|nr:stage III sporulation protein AE [Bacillota bacterium]